jgi:hypothetical protein
MNMLKYATVVSLRTRGLIYRGSPNRYLSGDAVYIMLEYQTLPNHNPETVCETLPLYKTTLLMTYTSHFNHFDMAFLKASFLGLALVLVLKKLL